MRTPVLVLLPGLDGTGLLFKPLLDLMSDISALVVRYPKDEVLSKDQLVDVIQSQLPRNRVLILLAESFSGPLVLSLLRRNLPEVKGVIFCATFARSPHKTLLEVLNYLPLSIFLRFPSSAFIKRVCLNGCSSKDILLLVRDSITQVEPAVLAGRLRLISKMDECYPNPGVEHVSCCYLQAVDDRLVPKSCVDDFKSLVPDLNIVGVNGPHFLLQARPRECWHEIKKFINGISKRHSVSH